jgi:tetratricopeptide (TPR) repeat protein
MKTIKYVTLILGGGLLVFSCKKSFLERQPQGTLSEQTLSNAAGVNALLIGAYAALDGQQNNAGSVNSLGGGNAWACSPDNWLWGSVAGGDAHKGSDAGDQAAMVPVATFTVDPSNALLNDKWRAVYEGIGRCNSVLRLLPNVTDLSTAEKANISGQARFLRGHYYFDLKRIFNMVPYIEETTTDYKTANTTDIWPNIEADFKFALDNLPATQTDIGRVNKWAAAAYLGKSYLYEKKYTEAKQMFDQVINQGTTTNALKYDVNPNFENNFRPEFEKTNPEAVFVVEMAANTGGGSSSIANANQGDMLNHPYGNSPFGCCGFYQPTVDIVNSYRTDANGLPYLDDYNQHPVKNDMGVTSGTAFTPDAGTLDPRLDWTVGRRTIPYKDWGLHPGADWIRDPNFAGPYSPLKLVPWKTNSTTYQDKSSWAPGSAINIYIIRFADVLLMAAETEAQLNNLAQAQTYVNRVRSRISDHPDSWLYQYKDNSNPTAGFSTTPAANYKIAPYPAGYFSSKDVALKAIYFERKLELAMEGHRFFDLSRWGIASTTLNAFFSYEGAFTTDIKGAKFTANKNEYFPIPQSQIDLTLQGGQKTLTQNKGYQ